MCSVLSKEMCLACGQEIGTNVRLSESIHVYLFMLHTVTYNDCHVS